jgi:hypothetical protein
VLSCPKGFNASEYAVNIGLALKQVKTAKSQVRVNINTVPEVYLPKPRPVIEVVSWAFVAAAIVVLVPLAILTQQSLAKTSALQAQVNNVQLQVQAKQRAKVVLDKLQADLVKAKAAQDVFKQPLDGFKVQRAKVNGDLSRITSLLPGTVDLNSVGYGKSFEISGTAPDEATILGYTRALRDTNRFAQVIVSDMHKTEYNRWAFILTLK